jgi:catechol 2,3-dioxygenase-like lactoylglutathione lyase family enzyme
MPRIRHVAIATEDPEGTAKFYKDALGLFEVGKVQSALAEGYYLSDGYINLAILKYRTDEVATTEGAPRHAGIHHLGFEVEDMEASQASMIKAGATPHLEQHVNAAAKDRESLNVELKYSGPDGVTLDLSAAGWVTSPD